MLRSRSAASGRRVTWLDPFGRHPIRRLERELIAEFTALVTTTSAGLDRDNYDRAVEVAATPDLIRGFDHIKERNVALYRSRLADLRTREDDRTFTREASS
jgi:indolepyruvate ferredoxin oxidoreductase